jgi:hypothetical protein
MTRSAGPLAGSFSANIHRSKFRCPHRPAAVLILSALKTSALALYIHRLQNVSKITQKSRDVCLWSIAYPPARQNSHQCTMDHLSQTGSVGRATKDTPSCPDSVRDESETLSLTGRAGATAAPLSASSSHGATVCGVDEGENSDQLATSELSPTVVAAR